MYELFPNSLKPRRFSDFVNNIVVETVESWSEENQKSMILGQFFGNFEIDFGIKVKKCF